MITSTCSAYKSISTAAPGAECERPRPSLSTALCTTCHLGSSICNRPSRLNLSLDDTLAADVDDRRDALLRERRHKRAGQARSARRHAGRAWGASSERKDISLHARIEKLDLEHSIGNRLGLPDELVEPLFSGRAVALLVDVGPVSIPRRAPIKEHAETYRRSATWRSHDQVQIARVKPVDDATVGLVERYGTGVQRPIAAERPFIEPE